MAAERRPRITHSRSRPPAARAPLDWAGLTQRYLAALVAREASPLTYGRYQAALQRWSSWWADARPEEPLTAAAVTGSDLRDYREALRAEELAGGRQRRASSVNALLGPVLGCLRWAHAQGLLDRLPELPRRLRQAPSRRTGVEPQDQRRLLRAVERGRSRRDWALVLVLLDTGVRVAELCALRWRDVELTRGRSELRVWGKGSREGVVPLSRRARRALLELRQALQPHADAPVFGSRKGSGAQPLSPRGVQDLLVKYSRLAGTSVRLHPHQFRHALATDLLARGEQLPTVQALLRHRSPATTLGYTHTSAAAIRAAVEREPDDSDEGT